MSNLITATYNGTDILLTKAQKQALDVLTSTNGGGIAVVHDYVSESGRTSPETADITFISRFSYERLNKRKLKELEDITLDTIRPLLETYASDAVKAFGIKAKAFSLKDMDDDSLRKEFDARKDKEIESIKQTLSGDRSGAHREAHDRCYLRIDAGVRVHFKTVADSDGIKQPVTLDGVPIVESILLEMLEISRRIKVEGIYKKSNSGIPVLISNAIHASLSKGVKFKALSLKENNFSSLTIGGDELLPEDFRGIF